METNSVLTQAAEGRRLASDGTGRAVRLETGTSLTEMARELGVTQTALWRWETGIRRPSQIHAVAYSHLIASLSALLCGDK